MKHKLVKDINTQTPYKFVKNDNLTQRTEEARISNFEVRTSDH